MSHFGQVVSMQLITRRYSPLSSRIIHPTGAFRQSPRQNRGFSCQSVIRVVSSGHDMGVERLRNAGIIVPLHPEIRSQPCLIEQRSAFRARILDLPTVPFAPVNQPSIFQSQIGHFFELL